MKNIFLSLLFLIYSFPIYGESTPAKFSVKEKSLISFVGSPWTLIIYMLKINKEHIGSKPNGIEIDNKLYEYDLKTKNHRIEKIGIILRNNMSNMIKLK